MVKKQLENTWMHIFRSCCLCCSTILFFNITYVRAFEISCDCLLQIRLFRFFLPLKTLYKRKIRVTVCVYQKIYQRFLFFHILFVSFRFNFYFPVPFPFIHCRYFHRFRFMYLKNNKRTLLCWCYCPFFFLLILFFFVFTFRKYRVKMFVYFFFCWFPFSLVFAVFSVFVIFKKKSPISWFLLFTQKKIIDSYQNIVITKTS